MPTRHHLGILNCSSNVVNTTSKWISRQLKRLLQKNSYYLRLSSNPCHVYFSNLSSISYHALYFPPQILTFYFTALLPE